MDPQVKLHYLKAIKSLRFLGSADIIAFKNNSCDDEDRGECNGQN